MRHIGRSDEQLRVARALLQIAEGHAAVERIEPAREKVRAPHPGRGELDEVARVQRLRNQAALEVLAQKRIFELGQTFGARGRKVGRNDAAAGDAADHIGGVEQGSVLAHPVKTRLLHGTEHAKAKRRRTRPATRERDCDQHAGVALGNGLQQCLPLGRSLLRHRQRGVEPGARGRTADEQHSGQQQRTARARRCEGVCRPPMQWQRGHVRGVHRRFFARRR